MKNQITYYVYGDHKEISDGYIFNLHRYHVCDEFGNTLCGKRFNDPALMRLKDICESSYICPICHAKAMPKEFYRARDWLRLLRRKQLVRLVSMTPIELLDELLDVDQPDDYDGCFSSTGSEIRRVTIEFIRHKVKGIKQ